uniref:Heat shock factor binding protein 1 n=1 Tax=Buteo japonicus TaxID=224669 RepID=A0A8B9ZAE7_9AVES
SAQSRPPLGKEELSVQTLLQQMQDKFQTIELDDMSCRIDDLEKNIADLMTQAGVEELEGENKTPATNKS